MAIFSKYSFNFIKYWLAKQDIEISDYIKNKEYENLYGKDVINECLIKLDVKLKFLDLNFEDIIMFSHVDEIPDLSKIESIK